LKPTSLGYADLGDGSRKAEYCECLAHKTFSFQSFEMIYAV
jgi:hypothetical protein